MDGTHWKRKGKKDSFLACIFVFTVVYSIKGDSSNRCVSEETCGECIAESALCAWCSQENFTDLGVPRCDLEENLNKICNRIFIPEEFVHKLTDWKLSDRGVKENEAIQIKPQEIRLRIRPNSIHSFKLEFRQAVDYPVDLYYLMDLSNSMEDDKFKLSLLGNRLANEMKTITTNFQLGFGSFVDKTVAPYVNMHPEMLEEPCTGCAAPYGFRNNMPLSSTTDEFAKKVREAKISGNLDASEGGFDAIMQAIVCKDEIGWRDNSRKLLVLSTDNQFHYAGDGKLGGAVAPNDESCHLDANGYYTMSANMDYPSLSQLNHQIKEKKMNLIFAVTSSQLEIYDKLSKRLKGSSTGKLDDDSSNVVTLIRNKYEEITSSVEMTDDNNDANIKVSYYSKCLGTNREETNICTNLKVGTNVTFDVNIGFSFCPKERKLWNRTFEIFPVGLNDHLTVHLEMLCECDCEKPWNEEAHSSKCSSGNGTFECGICNCNDRRYGKQCECDAGDTDLYLQALDCYNGNDSRQCSGQGTCICGQCKCATRPIPEEKISGKFCECNNFNCDRKNGKVCSGPDHGECECGDCNCRPGWKGPDCSCRDTTATCVAPNGEICSGHGKCKCGECTCETSEQEYYGTFCEDCSTCPGLCNEMKQCVQCWVEENLKEKTKDLNCSGCDLDIKPAEQIVIKSRKEKSCTFEDKERCRYSFKYSFDEQNTPIVYAKELKDCPPPVNMVAIVSGVSGSIVGAGLFLLFLWKLLTTIHDRRELAKFEKEKLQAKWQHDENPIYKPSTTTFQNPAYGGD